MLDLLKKRRSIRRFKPDKIEKEKIDELIKAALLSPSSRNICPWEFIVVTEKELLEKLSKSKPHGAAFLKDAPLGIVVTGNTELSDAWVEDTSIASILIQMTAESLGLGTCWIQIRNRPHDKQVMAEEYIRNLLHIPQPRTIESIIAVGYSDEQKPPHNEEELHIEKVHLNHYGTGYK